MDLVMEINSAIHTATNVEKSSLYLSHQSDLQKKKKKELKLLILFTLSHSFHFKLTTAINFSYFIKNLCKENENKKITNITHFKIIFFF